MVQGFLTLVGLLYLSLGIWCAVDPVNVAQKVGFELQGGSGKSEFFVVYGGLEFALGLIFLLPWIRSQATETMLLCCLVIHTCLVLFRTVSLFQFAGVSSFTRTLFTYEILLCVLSAVVYVLAYGLRFRQQ